MNLHLNFEQRIVMDISSIQVGGRMKILKKI
jgi:hypothetical protein